jgi:hypothetical protein
LDEENAIFLLHGEKYFGFVRGNGGFFGARAFLPRVSAEQEKELFRAEAQRRGRRREMMKFFRSKNSASLILCARWMADEVVSDLSLDILILTDRPHSNSSFAALLVEKNQYLVNNFNFWIELNKVLD